MSIRNKKKTLANISVSKRTIDGVSRITYCASCGTDEFGKRVRIVRSTKQECIEAVEEYYNSITAYGGHIGLSPTQLIDAANAFALLKAKELNETLSNIIRDYIFRSSDVIETRDLLDAYNEYYNSFDELQVMQLKCVQSRVGRFAMTLPDKPVHLITAQDVISFLDTLEGCAPKTWNNYKQYISSFFEWCSKKVRKYCLENPIKDLEKKMIPYKVPEFASVKDVQILFDELNIYSEYEKAMLTTYFALSFFCGMRRQEILRLSPEDVHLDRGSIFVRLPKGWTKGIPPRNFHIPPTADKILRTVDWANALRLGISEAAVEKHIRMCREMGCVLPKNAGRHSFITYHVAAFGNPSITEGIVGTSSKMRTAHYMGLADKTSGEAYFAISV